jgi:signal transduction histidine kinase
MLRVRTTCSVDSIWREAWDSLKIARGGRDATLQKTPSDIDPAISVGRFRLVKLFRNLLENSVSECDDPVLIQVECRNARLSGQPGIEIRERDNGPGLTPSARHSVFEPLFTTKTKRTGLGMAIARRIVDPHGGQISVGE